MDLINGNIKKLFHQFLVPAIGGALVVAAYSFVDTIAIGQGVGADGTAACAVFLPVFCIADFIGILCGIGGSALLGNAKGSGQNEKANAYFSASVLLVLLFTVVSWVALFLFQEPLYRLFGADETLLPYVMEYSSTIVSAFPGFVLIAFLPGFLRNDGVPNLIMNASLIGAATNIIGDWLFVFPLRMGMFGAALATVLGCLINCALYPPDICDLLSPSWYLHFPERISAIHYAVKICRCDRCHAGTCRKLCLTVSAPACFRYSGYMDRFCCD